MRLPMPRCLPGSVPGRVDPPLGTRLHESAGIQLTERLVKFGAAVHHNRPVPGNRFAKRGARNQQKPNPHFAGGYLNLVTGTEDDQCTVARLIADQGAISWEPPRSTAGNNVLFRAEMDLIAVMSACPQDITPVNGAACVPTELHFRLETAE